MKTSQTQPARTGAHTAGPWRISDNGKAIIGRTHSDVVVYSGNGESMISSEANAALIAAAPDLLEALRAILFVARGAANESNFNKIHELAQNAIAKAQP